MDLGGIQQDVQLPEPDVVMLPLPPADIAVDAPITYEVNYYTYMTNII